MTVAPAEMHQTELRFLREDGQGFAVYLINARIAVSQNQSGSTIELALTTADPVSVIGDYHGEMLSPAQALSGTHDWLHEVGLLYGELHGHISEAHRLESARAATTFVEEVGTGKIDLAVTFPDGNRRVYAATVPRAEDNQVTITLERG